MCTLRSIDGHHIDFRPMRQHTDTIVTFAIRSWPKLELVKCSCHTRINGWTLVRWWDHRNDENANAIYIVLVSLACTSVDRMCRCIVCTSTCFGHKIFASKTMQCKMSQLKWFVKSLDVWSGTSWWYHVFMLETLSCVALTASSSNGLTHALISEVIVVHFVWN